MENADTARPLPKSDANNYALYNNTTNNNIIETPPSTVDLTPNDNNALQITDNRMGPEGKDNEDSSTESQLMDTKENTYTDVNGKVTTVKNAHTALLMVVV